MEKKKTDTYKMTLSKLTNFCQEKHHAVALSDYVEQRRKNHDPLSTAESRVLMTLRPGNPDILVRQQRIDGHVTTLYGTIN